MNRHFGVIASAIVAMLGSIIALAFAVLGVAAAFVDLPQPQPPNGASFAIAGAAMFFVLGCVGIWTSVGLFRLRPWARTAMLTFAAFMAALSIFFLIMTMVLPVPVGITANTDHTFRRMTTMMFGLPFVIAVWWLIQFNTPSTKAAFAQPTSVIASPRPLSITIIAWVFIIGGASALLPLLTRMPSFLFGMDLNGWAAGVVYGLFVVLQLYIGKGLLDLREEARILAIGFLGFSLANVLVITLVPALRQRTLGMEAGLNQNQPASIPFDPGMMMNVMLVFTVITAAVTIWFLVRNSAAFGRVDSA